MKTISLAVSESDYEAFRTAAKRQGQPVAQLIRQAMSVYRSEQLDGRSPLRQLPVLPGPRPQAELPLRADLYDEIFG